MSRRAHYSQCALSSTSAEKKVQLITEGAERELISGHYQSFYLTNPPYRWARMLLRGRVQDIRQFRNCY